MRPSTNMIFFGFATLTVSTLGASDHGACRVYQGLKVDVQAMNFNKKVQFGYFKENYKIKIDPKGPRFQVELPNQRATLLSSQPWEFSKLGQNKNGTTGYTIFMRERGGNMMASIAFEMETNEAVRFEADFRSTFQSQLLPKTTQPTRAVRATKATKNAQRKAPNLKKTPPGVMKRARLLAKLSSTGPTKDSRGLITLNLGEKFFEFNPMNPKERNHVFPLNKTTTFDWRLDEKNETITFIFNDTKSALQIESAPASRMKYEHFKDFFVSVCSTGIMLD